MYLLITCIIILLLLLTLLFKHLHPPGDPRIPKLSLLEYLPGRLLHPLLKDAMNTTLVMRNIARHYGPIFYMYLGPFPMLLSSIPQDITDIHNSSIFGRPPLITSAFNTMVPGGLTSMPPDIHRATRKVMKQRFNTSMLHSFQHPMADAVAELCHTLAQAATTLQPDGNPSVLDINHTIALTTFRVITNVSFGAALDRPQREQFTKVALAYFEEAMSEIIGYPFRQMLSFLGIRKRFFECKREIDAVCLAFIRDRMAESDHQREHRQPDILDVFLNLENATEQTVLSLVVTFILAGSHSSNQVLSWSIYEACCNPHVSQQLEQELDRELGNKPLDQPITIEELAKLHYVHKVWKETLRIRPTGAFVVRVASKDHTLKGSGVRVPKGLAVSAFTSHAYARSEFWSDAEKFKPERWGHDGVRGEGDKVPGGAYIPFGLGVQNCAGRFLADYEGPLILAELYRRFRFSLACRPERVVTRSSFVDSPRYSSKNDGNYDMGVPVRVSLRKQ